METIALTLGTVPAGQILFQFFDFEVPEVIHLGSSQDLAVKKLIGGNRVIDSLGADPKSITWSGIFFPTQGGQSALDRVQQLKAIMDAGQPIALAFDELYYQVFISEFEPDYQFYRIPYKITCEVLRDMSAPSYSPDLSDLDSDLNSDMSNATSLAGTIGDSTLTGLVGNISSGMSGVTSFIGANSSIINPILASVHVALNYVSGAKLSTDVSLNAALNSVGVGGVLAGVSTSANVSSLTGVLSATLNQSGYSQIGGILGRMQLNLSSISSSGKSISVSGGSLFSVASAQFGNPSAWTQIAQSNNLQDPQISGNRTITIPPFNPNGSDGVFNQ